MYHDDREISAEKIIETLEAQVMKLTEIPEDARRVLMLVLIARIGKPTQIMYELSEKLMAHSSLASITLNIFDSLLRDAQKIIDSSDDVIFLLTHLAAKTISFRLNIDPRHPKLVAALVGTIQSTLSTALFEATPNTAELSLGLLGDYPKDSIPMSDSTPEHQRDLISMRLAARDINAVFTPFTAGPRATQPTFVIDAPDADPITTLFTIQEILKNHTACRLLLIQTWGNIADTWTRLRALIESRAEIEAVINFSSLPGRSGSYTTIIINTHPSRRETLYIDVSLSNKSLPHLDGYERMLLAGSIYNLWQDRVPHSNSEYLSSGVRRFINSYFSEGFRPISRLCNTVGKRPVAISKDRVSRHLTLKAAHGKLTRQTHSDNSKLISLMLESRREPCCIYIIGNNGEGKSFLLRDIVYQLEEAQKRSIGIPMSHADRFPLNDKSIRRYFEYKGARQTKVIKEVGALSSDSRKVELLSDCLRMIGFGSQIYLILKSELSHDRFGNPRKETLNLSSVEDMQYLNSDRRSIGEYELNVVGEEHRTIPFDNLSSGQQSILSLLLKIIAADAEEVIFLIDEPEISLHVSWQQKLPSILNTLSSRLNASFVVATHSPILIANAADEDICYVSKIGVFTAIPVHERHSVETLLMDGFETYTPHNKEVHERCAKLVASLVSATSRSEIESLAEAATRKLKTFKETIEVNWQDEGDARQVSDLALVEQTLGVIRMLREESDALHD
nr:AAA family ATPase [uncultured Pseudomonas sp.]